ncbi:MAG: S-layer homology domain-containing protein, partial [Firmicutes bacterium]|nr:S-layer homology domain-containing protein [Bacillota bacterium]
APDNATNQAVAWSSSNTAIAAVDANGKVTAVAPGAATITVTTADGGKTAACAVKVSVPVTGVALNKTAASLTVGTTDTLTATIAPDNATNKTIAWSSSDAAVAAVDASGKITALTPGAATITVTTADGGKTASCAVTVIRVYTITVTAGTGGAVYGGGKFNAGASVTLTAVPRNGDVFDGWYENRVKVSGAGAVYTFTAAADRALEARFAYKNPYSDVSASDWFYTDVQYATEVNLMNGTGGNLFEPNEPITRAMMATVLWRMAGSPALGDPSGFTDVPAKQWYTAAVSWAAANNIVFGYGNKLFGPNDLCTRQDMAVIFSRYIVLKRIALPAGAPKTFGDAADISGYAKSAVDQLTAAGILLGRPNNSFDPAGTATRAEAAAVLHRFSEAIK